MSNREIDALIAEKIMGRIAKPYSTDIASAWQVVEKFVKDGREVGVSFIRNPYNDFVGWICDIGPKDGFRHVISVEEETAPMAICLAALKDIGVTL